MKNIKCITFDKKAQDNLPEHIKAKMKADRDKARNVSSFRLQTLMIEISDWSDKQFGTIKRNPAIVYHLLKEVQELIDEFNSTKNLSDKQQSIRMEFADCFMLILDSAHNFGLSADDLIDASKEKLEINKERKWGNPDKNGVIEHIHIEMNK